MPYIKHIALRHCRNIESLDIDLTPGDEVPFRHLILTGPNGSGKTGALEAIQRELALTAQGQFRSVIEQQRAQFAQRLGSGIGAASAATLERALQTTQQQLHERPAAVSFRDGEQALQVAASSQRLVLAALQAMGTMSFHPSRGPTQINSAIPLPASPTSGTSRAQLAHLFVQYLVNQKVTRSLARDDGDDEDADRIDDWFSELESTLAEILNVSALTLKLDRQTWSFWFESPDLSHSFDIHSLASGWLASIYTLGEILLRVDAIQRAHEDYTYEPPGIVIIDEIEAHLHLRLQERILPLLTSMFPKIQFIVATHSPAIISSITNAVVHDLGSGKHYLSDELQGIRYGDLMTSHFGIESDLDLDSTRKLERLTELGELDALSASEEAELTSLAAELSARSHTLSLEVWHRLRGRNGHSDAGAEKQPGAAS